MENINQIVEKKKRVYNRKKTQEEGEGSSTAPVKKPRGGSKKTKTQEGELKEEKIPKKPERKLFDHQVESVELMERAETGVPIKDKDTGFDLHYAFGSLENPVGSGKTSVVLQVIKNDKLKFETIEKLPIRSLSKSIMLFGDVRPFYADVETGQIINRDVTIALFTCPISVVVCSKPLTTVWKKEADIMDVPNVVLDAPKQVSSRAIFEEKVIPIIKAGNGILITTTVLYAYTMSLLLEITKCVNPMIRPQAPYGITQFFSPKRMIYDDVHSVSKWSIFNWNLAPLFTWCVNSTPELVAWCQIERYLAACFLTRPLYNARWDMREKGHKVNVPVPDAVYREPPAQVNKIHYKGNVTAQMLGDHLPPQVVMMLNTGDFDGAYRIMMNLSRRGGEEDILEENEENPHQHLPVSERKPLHELVIQGYRNELQKLEARRLEIIEYGGRVDRINESIEFQKRKIASVEERLKDAEKETCDCPICCDEVERGEMAVTKCCNNSFCKGCIQEVFRGNKLCPLCRVKITPLDIYSLSQDGSAVDISEITSMKVVSKRDLEKLPANPMEALMKLVESKPRNSKFVVFAPGEGSSTAFKEYFKNSRYVLADLGGSSASIRNRLESFQNGSINILFLSSKTSNAGLNLQFATDVVIIEGGDRELNPDVGYYKQSIGRVRRFPRTEPVPVHHITVYPGF